jgi:arylsulfatase A-like enzyme
MKFGKCEMRRRDFLIFSAGAASCASALLQGCSTVRKQVLKKPNVVLISADDLGYGDLGCYGSDDIVSPNIDRIASDGILFENFYSSSPVCTPARGCLLTGLYPQKLGLAGPLMGEGGMSSRFDTLADVLSRNGYYTALVGKWHLGYSGDTLPNNQGFDYFFGHRGGKINFYEYTDTAQPADDGNPMGKHDLYENNKEVFANGKYSTELFTDKAIDFIKENHSKPFFLKLAYNAPHYSKPGLLQAPREYIKRFGDPENPTDRQIYAAMVACMDDGIGKLTDTLEQLGIADETVIIFVSDNGADENHGGNNGGLRGGKWTLLEGGLKIPFVMRLPGGSITGKVFKQRVHMIDVFPTVLELCGVEIPQSADGLPLGEYITNSKEMPERKMYFSHSHPVYGDQIAVIDGYWKYVVFKDEAHLFNIADDPYENNNLIETYPDMAKKMCNAYQNWIENLEK